MNRSANMNSVSEWKTPRLMAQDDANAELKTEEEIRQEIHAEAFEQGFAEGKARGLEEMSRQTQQFQALLDALGRPFADQNDAIVEHLAQLAGRIAKLLVRRELRTQPESIMALVRDTVTALNSSNQEIAIHLNPQMAAVVRKLTNDDSKEGTWKIIDDPAISQTDCRVHCGDSLIDAGLEARINMIITDALGDERGEQAR